jgi:hypothetical protein
MRRLAHVVVGPLALLNIKARCVSCLGRFRGASPNRRCGKTVGKSARNFARLRFANRPSKRNENSRTPAVCWSKTKRTALRFRSTTGQGGLEPPTSGVGDQDFGRIFGLSKPNRVAAKVSGKVSCDSTFGRRDNRTQDVARQTLHQLVEGHAGSHRGRPSIHDRPSERSDLPQSRDPGQGGRAVSPTIPRTLAWCRTYPSAWAEAKARLTARR